MLVCTAFIFNILYMFCTFNKQSLLFASDVGPRVMDYKYQPDAAHRCKRDVLLCRLKSSEDTTWKRIRPRPARNNFLGAFVLCKGISLFCTFYNGAWFTFNTVMNVINDHFIFFSKNFGAQSNCIRLLILLHLSM